MKCGIWDDDDDDDDDDDRWMDLQVDLDPIDRSEHSDESRRENTSEMESVPEPDDPQNNGLNRMNSFARRRECT